MTKVNKPFDVPIERFSVPSFQEADMISIAAFDSVELFWRNPISLPQSCPSFTTLSDSDLATVVVAEAISKSLTIWKLISAFSA